MERRACGWRFRFLARHAARTGEPIVRTMEYEFPHAGFAKLMIKCCGLLLSLALCAGCATTCVRETPRAVRLGTARVETTALVEALRTQVKGTRVQALNGAWRDQVFQAQCVLKGDGETLTVVFLAPQMRLVTIAVTKPHAIRCERAPRIPSAFEPEYALVDLAFVNLETATLRRAVGTALTIDDDGAARRIFTPSGEPVAEVLRQPDGTIQFRNLLHGYSYTLKQVDG